MQAMALDTRTPGVYVQEVSIFPPSISSVATAIPAFIGYTESAGGEVARITSMNDYRAKFGGPHKYLKVTITGSSLTGASVSVAESGRNFSLFYALQLYFANGGGPCYIVSAGEYDTAAVSTTEFDEALALLALEDEPTLIVAPDIRLLNDVDDVYEFYKAALAQCNSLQDRFTIIDTFESPTDVGDAQTEVHDKIGTQNLKYGAVYMPDLLTTIGYSDDAVYFHDQSDSDAGPATVRVFGEIDGLTLSDASKKAQGSLAANVNAATQLLAIVKPTRDQVATKKISLPPSSAIAGVYATVDRTRGVWKAPANISLNAVVKPTLTITDALQADLNVPTNGKAINVIRAFTGKGILVWGARTLAGNDNEWRYVSVRRFFIMAEESIRKATEWVVFEPNDANLWLKVKTMIENYLENLWKDGALAGAVPKDAFFVKVGLHQTMTPDDILNGRLIIEIGMAVVRPAEFVILRFSHKMQES